MKVRVQISYNMMDGKERECQDYLANNLAPGLSQLGFKFSEVWLNIWGDSPQILSGGEVDSIDKARHIFLSDEWQELSNGMDELTDSFRVRFFREN